MLYFYFDIFVILNLYSILGIVNLSEFYKNSIIKNDIPM